jgi:hypothetical protein
LAASAARRGFQGGFPARGITGIARDGGGALFSGPILADFTALAQGAGALLRTHSEISK